MKVSKLLYAFWIAVVSIFSTVSIQFIMLAETFSVPTGDVARLIEVIDIANANGEPDIIELGGQVAARAGTQSPEQIGIGFGGTYRLESLHNSTLGNNGLPVISSEITIRGRGAVILRDEGLVCTLNILPVAITDFRIFLVESGAKLILENVKLRNGCANVGLGIQRQGGAILNLGTTILNEATLSNNTAGGGGAVRNRDSGRLELNKSTLSDNTSTSGGGIMTSENGVIMISNSTISSNSAGESGKGGGISITGGSGVIRSSNITGNRAKSGGGIYNGSDDLTIENTRFSTNHAGENGGGLTNFEGIVSLTGVTFSDNESDISGGGIWNNGALIITNSTLSGNMALEGGSLFNDGTITLNNATLFNNIGEESILNTDGRVNIKNSIVDNCNGNLISQGHNLIQVVDENCIILGDPTGNVLNQDPKLGPLKSNGGPTPTHALLEGSRALDGTSDCTTLDGTPILTDQRGEPRTQSSLCDIGAYESLLQGPPPEENLPPTVTLSFEPQDPTETDTIQFTASASDPDDDPLTYEWFINGVAQTQIQVSTTQWQNPVPGTHSVRVRVSDGNGGVAEDTVTFTVRTAVPEPKQPLTIAQALDVNNNERLDDDEILTAIQLWISGVIVPGTDQTISDSIILELIQLWISGGSI